MEVERIQFCFVHGYAHPSGEMEGIDTIPHEFFIGGDAVGEVMVERCHEEEWDVVALDPSEYEVVNEEAVLSQNQGASFTLKAGDLAFIYTVRGGLVPCKVMKVEDSGKTEVRVTADRVGWQSGETEVIRNPHVSLVSRSQVSYHHGKPRISGGLAMVTDSGTLLR